MSKLSTILLLVICVTVSTANPGRSEVAQDAAAIDQLIVKLGSSSFRSRDAAKKELDAIGAPALDALLKAAESPDMEIATSAAALAARIGQRVELTRLLAPTEVDLTFKDTPIEEAVADLARQSGYPLVIDGDKSKLGNRKVTLKTGKTPFWKALDLLCTQGGLVEARDLQAEIGSKPVSTPSAPAANGPAMPVVVINSGGSVLDAKQPLKLVEGHLETIPACIDGALRIRALSSRAVDARMGAKPVGQLRTAVTVEAEPKLGVMQIVSVKVDRAIDNLDRSLQSISGPPTVTKPVSYTTRTATVIQNVAPMFIPICFPQPTQESSTIKDLRGTITIKLRTGIEPLATVENVLEAKGRTIKGKADSQLTVIDVKKQDDGEYGIEFELKCINDVLPKVIGPENQNQLGGLVINPTRRNNTLGVELMDAKLNVVPVRDVKSRVVSQSGGRIINNTFLFKPGKDQEPFKLVFSGARIVSVDVPFTLTDVQLK